MYVCVCKAVTDRQLSDAIADGYCTRRQLADNFGVGKSCGKCIKQVMQILDANTELSNSVVAPLHPIQPQQQARKSLKEATCLDDLMAHPSMA